MIWYNDFVGFVNPNKWSQIIPLQQYTFEDKLNALFRLSIYIGILLTMAKSDSRFLLFPIVMATLTIILNSYNEQVIKQKETYLDKKDLGMVENRVCRKSTIDNPFMNVPVTDFTTMGAKFSGMDETVAADFEACDIDNPKIKQSMQSNFHARLFRDVNDIFDTQASQRQYYTMPVTTNPNDQTAFAEWLYGRGKSCKQANGGTQCLQNIYTPLNLG